MARANMQLRYLTIRRGKGLIVLVSPNKSDRKSNNKVSKCKLKKDLFGNKTKEISYSMTVTNSPLAGFALVQ